MKRRFAFIPAFLSLSLGLQAQNFSDFDWPTSMSKAEVPAKYAEAKAVVINKEDYNKSVFTGEFPYIEQLALRRTQTHYKIQSEESAKELSRMIVPKLAGEIADYVQIKHVDVRVRKKGSEEVVDYSVRQLPLATLKEDDELYSQREDLYVYELPALGIGDEIEQVIVYEAKFADDRGTVTLYESYPVLSSSHTLSLPMKIGLRFNVYNGMNQPEVKTLGDQRICTWKASDLDAVPEANASGSIFAEKLAYFVYELNFDGFREFQPSYKIVNWGDLIYRQAEDFFDPLVNRKKTLTDWYEKYIFEGKDPKSISPIEKVFKLHDYLTRNMKIISERDLESIEKSQGLEYFLAKNKVTYNTLMCVYRDFFSRYGITYYLAIGKNRFQGPFDMAFVSSSQVTDYFYVVDIPQKGQFMITPLSGFNQVSNGLMGTKALMRGLEDRKSQLLELNIANDPLKEVNRNKRIERQTFTVDSKGKAQVRTVLDLNGAFSTARASYLAPHKADTLALFLNGGYKQAFKDRGTVKVDSAKIEKWDNIDPFPFRVEAQLQMENFFKVVSEKEWTFELEGILNHNLRYVSNAEKRILDYYLPFAGGDVQDLVFNFESEVELSGLEEVKIENEAGSYRLRIMKINPKSVRIESRYTIKEMFLSKDKVGLLKELTDAAEKAEKAVLTFKFK